MPFQLTHFPKTKQSCHCMSVLSLTSILFMYFYLEGLQVTKRSRLHRVIRFPHQRIKVMQHAVKCCKVLLLLQKLCPAQLYKEPCIIANLFSAPREHDIRFLSWDHFSPLYICLLPVSECSRKCPVVVSIQQKAKLLVEVTTLG